RTMRKTGSIAVTPEPIAESLGRVGLARCRDQESEITRRAAIDDVLQYREDRQLKGNWLVASVLGLGEAQPALPDMLTPEQHHIRTTLACVEQQRQSKVCPCADGVMRFKFFDLLNSPAVMASGFPLEVCNLTCRIAFDAVNLLRESPSKDLPQSFHAC